MKTQEANRRGQGCDLLVDRRALIAGVLAAGLLGSCSGPADRSSRRDLRTFLAIKRFPESVAVLGEVRLPHSLSLDAESVSDGPLELGAQVFDLDGNAATSGLSATRRDVAPSSYDAWRATIDSPGFYVLVIDGADPGGSAFQVFADDAVSVSLVGSALEGFDTPRFDEPGGLDPICTRDPVCPFHTVTLSDALLDVDRGVVYLVGTPAFCDTGTCTPGLEALIAVADDFADDFVFVHAEVYTDLTTTDLSPAVEALGVQFEPVLFVADWTGVILHRLDAIWNDSELRDTLSSVQAS